MKRGMVAVLFLVLLTSLVWAADWYRYQGTYSENCRSVTGETSRSSTQYYVYLCYETTPGTIQVTDSVGDILFTGQFDKEGTKLQFTASGGGKTIVGRGSFNASETTLNLQGWEFYRALPDRSQFGQIRFPGKFLNIVVR